VSLVDFFLNSKSTIVQFETIEISHPDFSKIYRVVRNKTDGLTATLETTAVVTFDYYPLQISKSSTEDDLDYAIEIEIGDLGEVLPTELDLVQAGNGFATKPTLLYRTYRSDDLSVPMFGPVSLEITEITFNKTGAKFEAKAPSLNINRTGEVYSIDRFPMLRGFL